MKKDISYFDAETQKCIIDLAREMTQEALKKQMEKLKIEDLNYNQIEEVFQLAREMYQREYEKHIGKTWIVSQWKYNSSIVDGQLFGKKAEKLYCIETGKYKELK